MPSASTTNTTVRISDTGPCDLSPESWYERSERKSIDMKIRFLGTGSGWPDPDRGSSAVLFEGPEGALLVDAGEGCARRLREPDRWNPLIIDVILTHAHVDHLAGLPMLIQGYKGEKRSKPLTIHAPAPLHDPLEQWLRALRLHDKNLPFAVDLVALTAGEKTLATGHKINVWRNSHFPNDHPMGSSYSLTVSDSNVTWLYSSDIGNLDDIEPHLAEIDALILETTHVDPEEAAIFADKQGVKHVYLTHIPPDRIQKPIRNAIWVEDNMVIEASAL